MINISNLSLNDTSLKQVQFTQYTKILKAQNNQLTSSGLNYLLLNCKLRHTVEELYLQNNELDVNSLQYLTVFTCPRLRHVDLRQNRIVQNSVFELKFRQMYKDAKLVLDNQKELAPAVTLQITYTSPLMCSFCLKMFEKIQQQSGSAPTHTQTLKAQAEKLFQKIPRRSSQIMNVNEEPSQSDIDSVNSALNENGNETPKPDLGKLIQSTNEIANKQQNKLQNDLNQIKEEEERCQMQIQHTEKQIKEQQKQIQQQNQNNEEYILFQEENEIVEKETEKDKIFKEFALETDMVLKQTNNVANQINEAKIIKPITIQEQKECSFESVKTASGASSLSRSHSNSKLQTTKMRNRNAPKKQETPKVKQKSEENRSLSTSSINEIKLSVIQQQASVQYQQSLVPLIIAEDLQEIESVPSSTRTVPRYGIHDRFSKTHKPYKSQEDTANINFSQDDILVIKNIPDINRTIKQQLQINQEFRSDAIVNHDRQSRIIQILIQYEFLTPQFQSKYKINHLENLGLNSTLTPSKNQQIVQQQTTIIDETFSESIQHLDSIDTSIYQKSVELPPKNAQVQLALNEGVNLAPLEQSLSKSSKSSLMQKLLVQQQVVEQEIAGLDGNRSQEYLPQNNLNGSYSKRPNVDQQAPQQSIQKAQQQSNEVLSNGGIADYESVNISTLSQLQNGLSELKKSDGSKAKETQSSVVKLQQIHDNQRNDVSYGNTQFESINESNISEFNPNTKVESKVSMNAIPKIEQPMTSDKIPLPRNLFQRMTQDLAKVVEEPSFNNTDYGSVDTSALSGAPQQNPDQKSVELPPKNAQVQLALNEGVNLAPLEQSLSKSSKSSLMQKLLVQQQVVEQEIAGLDGNRSQEYLPQNNLNGSYSKRPNVDQQAPQQSIQKAQQQSNEVLSNGGIADYESVNISTLSQLQNGLSELKKSDGSKAKETQSSVVKLQQIHDNQRNDVSYGNTQFESINESNISEFNPNTKVESKVSMNAIPKIEQPMTSDKIPLPRNLFQRMTQDLAKVVEEPSFNNTDYGSVDTSALSGAPQQNPDQKSVELPPKNAQVQLALNEGVNLAPLEQSLSKSSKSSLMQKLLVQQQVVEQEIAGLDGNRSQEYLPQNNLNGSYSKRPNVDQQAPQQSIQKAQQQPNETLNNGGIMQTQTNQVQHKLDADSNQTSLNQNQIDTNENEQKPKFNLNFKSVTDNSSQENAFKPFIQNEIAKEQSASTTQQLLQQQVENELIYSPDQVRAVTNPVVFTVDSVQPIFSLENQTQNTQTNNKNITIEEQINIQQSRPKEQKLNAAVINFAQIYSQIPVKRRILHQPLSQEKFNQFSSPKRNESTFREEPLKIRKQKQIIGLKDKQQLQNSIFTLKQSISPSFKHMSKITSIRPNTLKLKQFTNVHQNSTQNQIADDYKNTQLYESDLNPLQKSANNNNTDLKPNDLNQNNNPNDLKELLTEYLHLKQFQKPQVLKKTLSNDKRDINPKIQEIVQIENVPIFRVTISPKLQMSDLNAPQPQSNLNWTQNINIENLMKMSKILDSSDSLDEERIQRLLETKERAKEIQMKKSALRQEEIDKEILRSLVLRNIELENEIKAKKIKQ
ncbi:Conserved_hypothetical protein [Hexamita inflata]|uniref:Uncharacterized protein n=1 Tax=Hexamita inflata TaxID=28002 RepID=A0AA86U575_9EUKA|nr:Conserved hypothetical protein [Hexamita inflata]